jgi:uncharacterized protein YuzE
MRSGSVEITYDPHVDALVVLLTKRGGKSAHSCVTSREAISGIYVDEDENGNLVAIEVLDASTRISRKQLDSLPSPVRILSLAEAAKLSRLAPDTLRSQINKGRLKAEKRGRDWTVSETELFNYLESRDARGRPSRRGPARRRKGRAGVNS